MIRCRVFGHRPAAGPGVVLCERCRRPIYFWRGQRTGWFLRPEGPDNEYVGVKWRAVEGRVLGLVAVGLAVFFGARWLW